MIPKLNYNNIPYFNYLYAIDKSFLGYEKKLSKEDKKLIKAKLIWKRKKQNMTLKKKFKQWLDTDPRVQIREVQLEVIADEFAIGFVEWVVDYTFNTGYEDNVSELLKEFKKEKGL